MVPQNAIPMKRIVSRPSPTMVEAMVLVQSSRPFVAFLRAESMIELENSPAQYPAREARKILGELLRTIL